MSVAGPVRSFSIAALMSVLVLSTPAYGQSSPDVLGDLSRLLGSGVEATGSPSVSGQIIQLFGLVTVLSLAPGILIVVTSFTRFIIAFSILRMGLGLQSTPANLILISLSLFMTFHVMSATFQTAWEKGAGPLSRGEITEAQAVNQIIEPFRTFMLANVRGEDIALFTDLQNERASAGGQVLPNAATTDEVPITALVPAFMISEIRRGFEIGFLILLPFLVIDLIVATIVMAMGMMMLPPTVVALPFKILFFVLIDGWNLLVGSLLRSFA